MIKVGYTFEDYYKCIQGKRVVAFSASAFLQLMAENYRELYLAEKVAYVVDNDDAASDNIFSADAFCNSASSLIEIAVL